MQESCIGCKAGPESAGQKAIRELIGGGAAAQRVAGEQNASSWALFRFGSANGRELLRNATCIVWEGWE